MSTNRVDVGDWLLETTELLEWNGSEGETEKAVLLCFRNPGVGKLYLRWAGSLEGANITDGEKF